MRRAEPRGRGGVRRVRRALPIGGRQGGAVELPRFPLLLPRRPRCPARAAQRRARRGEQTRGPRRAVAGSRERRSAPGQVEAQRAGSQAAAASCRGATDAKASARVRTSADRGRLAAATDTAAPPACFRLVRRPHTAGRRALPTAEPGRAQHARAQAAPALARAACAQCGLACRGGAAQERRGVRARPGRVSRGWPSGGWRRRGGGRGRGRGRGACRRPATRTAGWLGQGLPREAAEARVHQRGDGRDGEHAAERRGVCQRSRRCRGGPPRRVKSMDSSGRYREIRDTGRYADRYADRYGEMRRDTGRLYGAIPGRCGESVSTHTHTHTHRHTHTGEIRGTSRISFSNIDF